MSNRTERPATAAEILDEVHKTIDAAHQNGQPWRVEKRPLRDPKGETIAGVVELVVKIYPADYDAVGRDLLAETWESMRGALDQTSPSLPAK